MKIRKSFIKYAKSDDIWDFGNGILYNLCKKYPKHKEKEVILAKIWLIGRAYSASIERRKKKKGETEEDYFYTGVVIPNIQKSQLDKKLYPLKSYRTINDQSIPHILGAHKYLVDLFTRISGLNKRSLASKYLHFHLPKLFYLYDSRAAYSISQIMPRYRIEKIEGEFDDEYMKFFLKVHDLRNELYKRYNVRLNPRQIDNLLLNLY
jgi:hypothetical protein